MKRPSEQDFDRFRARCRANVVTMSPPWPPQRDPGMWQRAYEAALAVYSEHTYSTFDEMQRTTDRAHYAACKAAGRDVVNPYD
jgi:predicted RNA methylase